MTTVLDVIQHYQNSIDKSSKDEKRLLHCIEKLYNLRVTVQHLQETGIGKTVNTLRKYEGEVGVAAKALVAKWKAMVAAEESSAAEDDDNSSPNEEDKPHTKRETTNKPFLIHHEQETQNNHNNSNSSSSSNSNKHKSSHSVRHDRSDKHRSDREHKSESHTNSESSKDRSHHSRHGRDKEKSRDKTSELKEKNNSNNHASHKSSKVDNEIKIKQEHHSSSKSNSRDKDKLKPETNRKRSSTSSPDNLSNGNNLLKIKREKLSDDSDNEYHNLGENTKYKDKSMKSIQNNIKVKEEKIPTSSSSNSNHRTSSRDDRKTKCSSSSSSSGSTNNNHHNHQHSSNNHSSNEEHNRSRSSSTHKVKDEPVSSQRVSSSSKYKEKIKDEVDKEVKKSSKLSETDIFKTKKSLKREKDRNSDKHHSKTSSTSTSVPSTSKKLKSSNHKEVEEEEDFDGIDCTMGASFADALTMIQKPTPYKGINKKKTYNNSSPSSSSAAPTMSTPSTSKKFEVVKQIKPISTPSLLTSTAKLEPLDLEIEHVSELPIITNNYKPMPLNSTIMDCVFSNNNKPQRRQLTDEEAFGASISSKTVRTKVYSGIKTGALNQVPTLFDLCIKVLKKNIDALEYTGGVPFEILKPILEGATPQQLFTFEDYNPYLIDDSDMLWQHHCNRRFRGQKLQEFETWRDMFLRCQEEENLRFANLTENIKQSQKLSVPVKHTKLAYVDSLAKAPRNIQKKQNQFGTERKLVATPASRVASLSGVSSNIAKAGDFRLRVAPGTRDTAQANNTLVRKKAPLMLKTLQFMKGHLKR